MGFFLPWLITGPASIHLTHSQGISVFELEARVTFDSAGRIKSIVAGVTNKETVLRC